MEIAKFTRLEARRIVIFGHFVTLASPSLRLKMSCPSTQHLKLHPAHSGLETQIDGLREVGAMLLERGDEQQLQRGDQSRPAGAANYGQRERQGPLEPGRFRPRWSERQAHDG